MGLMKAWEVLVVQVCPPIPSTNMGPSRKLLRAIINMTETLVIGSNAHYHGHIIAQYGKLEIVSTRYSKRT